MTRVTETLVDVRELTREVSIALPTLISESVEELLEEIPFAEIGKASFEDRLAVVLSSAASAFERLKSELQIEGELARDEEYAVRFAVPLRSSSEEHPYRWLLLHYRSLKERGPSITIAEPYEVF